MENDQNEMSYAVVCNEEDQYSIWPADKALPDGWRKSGQQGSKAACLDYIRNVWTDMRPRSLRAQMDGMQD